MDEQSLLFSWWNTVYHLKILNFHIHVQYNKSKDQSTEVCICMILLNKKSFFGPTFTFWPTLTHLHGKTVGRVETKILNFLIISIWGFHPFLLFFNFANFLLWKKVKWYQYGFFIVSSILDTLANYSVSKRKIYCILKIMVWQILIEITGVPVKPCAEVHGWMGYSPILEGLTVWGEGRQLKK